MSGGAMRVKKQHVVAVNEEEEERQAQVLVAATAIRMAIH
jgi:hypothetical protein